MVATLTFAVFRKRRGVLKLLLPAVEQIGGDAQHLVAIGERGFVEKVAFEMATFSGKQCHSLLTGEPSDQVFANLNGTVVQIHLGQHTSILLKRKESCYICRTVYLDAYCNSEFVSERAQDNRNEQL